MSDPIIHRSINPGEIAAHGDHLDVIGLTSFGSHQMRFDPVTGRMIDQQLNINNALGGGHLPLDASGMPITGHNY